MHTTRMPVLRRVIAGFEVAIGVLGIASVAWPQSRFCSGWPLGHNCEAWFILGVNIFAPIGGVAIYALLA